MCSSPHRVFKTGLKTDTGKELLYFDNHYPCPDVVSLALVEKRLKVRVPLDPRFVVFKNGVGFLHCFVDVPCGKCESCRIQSAKNWAARCLMEAFYSKDNFFLTLTFDDDHLPEKVCTADVSMFMKRLRNELGDGIRFFASGEYGTRSQRPHYHILLFNCPLEDLYIVDGASKLFGSKLIDRIWPYGMHTIGAVSSSSAAYVARYTAKKAGDRKGFLLMSRRPGIGYRYLVERPSCIKLDYLPLNVDGIVRDITPPRYFEKIFPDFPWDDIKGRRIQNMRNKEALEAYLHRMDRYQYDDYKRALGFSKLARLEKRL